MSGDEGWGTGQTGASRHCNLGEGWTDFFGGDSSSFSGICLMSSTFSMLCPVILTGKAETYRNFALQAPSSAQCIVLSRFLLIICGPSLWMYKWLTFGAFFHFVISDGESCSYQEDYCFSEFLPRHEGGGALADSLCVMMLPSMRQLHWYITVHSAEEL